MLLIELLHECMPAQWIAYRGVCKRLMSVHPAHLYSSSAIRSALAQLVALGEVEVTGQAPNMQWRRSPGRA